MSKKTPTTPTEETRQITGNIWLDSNEDGVKDDTETKVADIEVLLLDNSTGKIMK